MTPTNEQMALANAAALEGITAFPYDKIDGGIEWFTLLNTLVEYCTRAGIEYEQPYTDQLKDGYNSLVEAQADAARILGLQPIYPTQQDMVMVPRVKLTEISSALRGAYVAMCSGQDGAAMTHLAHASTELAATLKEEAPNNV